MTPWFWAVWAIGATVTFLLLELPELRKAKREGMPLTRVVRSLPAVWRFAVVGFLVGLAVHFAIGEGG